MNLSENYKCEGQMSIFDMFPQDTWCGKTYQVPSVQTKEKTLDASLKKQRGSSIKMPLFLDRRKGSGLQADASWETGGAFLGEFTMHSFGESPNEERESRLSQILQENPHPKYSLSARACQGILNRARNRGKKLPEQLEAALIRQSVSKNEQDAKAVEKESLSNTREPHQSEHNVTNMSTEPILLESNQNHATVQTDGVSTALPASMGMGGGYVPMVTGTLDASYYKGQGERAGVEREVVCIEGNGSRESHKGDGYKKSETMYTLNTVEQHAVCVGNGQLMQLKMSDKVGTLNCMHDQQAVMVFEPGSASRVGGHVYEDEISGSLRARPGDNQQAVCYGFDRASFNQGKNAQFDFSVEEELAQTIVAKGPGGGTNETVGALCARDWKGVGSQYVNEGKCIVQNIGKPSK